MQFTKMHGTGNDFVMIDGRNLDRQWSTLSTVMCDRHFGIGADGLLVVALSKPADFRMRMFNPDGSEAEMCGNGIRCFAKYLIDEGVWPQNAPLMIETLAGIHEITTTASHGRVRSVRVGMGAPRVTPIDIPVAATGEEPIVDYPLFVNGETINVTCLSMGNPHAVAFIDTAVETWPLQIVGPAVEHHSFFPSRVNFEIVNVMDRSHLSARVWERGAGLTLACGSGACAIAVAAHLRGLVDDSVEVRLPGGALQVTWHGGGDVILEGPASTVFRGQWPD